MCAFTDASSSDSTLYFPNCQYTPRYSGCCCVCMCVWCAWLFPGAHLANHTVAIYQMCAQFNHCKITYQHPNLFNHWLQFHILNTKRTWFPKQSAPYAGTWTQSTAKQMRAWVCDTPHTARSAIHSLKHEQPPHTCTYQSQHTILTPYMTFVCSIVLFFLPKLLL